jgi:D-alanyl-D-alanine dipeptidase
MDTRSEAVLSQVMPQLAALVRAAAATLEPAGTYLLVVSGLRTSAEQNALYAQGRTAPGHIVTDAKAGESMHNYGLAVDVVPYLSGDGGALNWTIETPQYQAMVAAMKAQGLEWGGDWAGDLGDFDHFQMAGLPASPNMAMLDDYNAGDALPSIWSSFLVGSYDATPPSDAPVVA